jgi:hypothetical protein
MCIDTKALVQKSDTLSTLEPVQRCHKLHAGPQISRSKFKLSLDNLISEIWGMR